MSGGQGLKAEEALQPGSQLAAGVMVTCASQTILSQEMLLTVVGEWHQPDSICFMQAAKMGFSIAVNSCHQGMYCFSNLDNHRA